MLMIVIRKYLIEQALLTKTRHISGEMKKLKGKENKKKGGKESKRSVCTKSRKKNIRDKKK